MNIFCYSRSPLASARWHDDVRLNKMITESAQMLTANMDYLCYSHMDKYPDSRVGYPRSVLSHPCTKWARSSDHKLRWLLHYHTALAEMWGKPHKSARIGGVVEDFLNGSGVFSEVNHFCNAARNKSLGLDYTHITDVQDAYREYHKKRWSMETPTWTRNNMRPPWY